MNKVCHVTRNIPRFKSCSALFLILSRENRQVSVSNQEQLVYNVPPVSGHTRLFFILHVIGFVNGEESDGGLSWLRNFR